MRTISCSDKNYFIAKFPSGLPTFSTKKSAEIKWTLQKDGLQNRQIPDNFWVFLSFFFFWLQLLF